MITAADLAGYQAKAKGTRIPAGKTTRKGAPISAPEEQLAWQLTGAGLIYTREFAFHPQRRYRADFYFPLRLLVEVEGQGRHQRFAGFEADCEKYAEAMMRGFVVLRVTPRQITEGEALTWIQVIQAKLKGL